MSWYDDYIPILCALSSQKLNETTAAAAEAQRSFLHFSLLPAQRLKKLTQNSPQKMTQVANSCTYLLYDVHIYLHTSMILAPLHDFARDTGGTVGIPLSKSICVYTYMYYSVVLVYELVTCHT